MLNPFERECQYGMEVQNQLLIHPDSQVRQADSLTQKYKTLSFSLRQEKERRDSRGLAGSSHKNSQFRRDLRTKVYVYEYISACSHFFYWK